MVINQLKLINIIHLPFVLLFILLPFSILSGPFLTNLTVTLLALYALIFIIIYKKYNILKNHIFLIVLFFWLISILSSSLSLDPIVSFSSSIPYIRFIFFSFGIAIILNLRNNYINYFGVSIILCFSLVIIDAYYQYLTGSNFLGWKKNVNRLSGLFKEELILGSFLVRLFPVLLIFILKILKNKNIYLNFLCFVFLLLIEILIFLSGERTAFFFLIMETFLILIFVPDLRKFKLLILLSIIVSGIILISNFPHLKNRMIDVTIKQIQKNISSDKEIENSDLAGNNEVNFEILQNKNFYNKLESKTKENHYFRLPTLPVSVHHQAIYQKAFDYFFKEPFIGIGPKMFRKLCQKDIKLETSGCTSHPHSNYLQLLSETGLFGFLIFSSLLFLLFYKISKIFFVELLYNKNKLNNYSNLILIALFISLWPLAPSSNFFGSYINSIYYLPLGFYIFFNYKKIL